MSDAPKTFQFGPLDNPKVGDWFLTDDDVPVRCNNGNWTPAYRRILIPVSDPVAPAPAIDERRFEAALEFAKIAYAQVCGKKCESIDHMNQLLMGAMEGSVMAADALLNALRTPNTGESA